MERKGSAGADLVLGNRFEIADLKRDLIGRGGVGDVYRGKDLCTGQTVAIKVLRPEVVTYDPDALPRFVREGETLRHLNHPNIVKIVEAVEEEGRHYLVMEYVPGGSLRNLLDVEGQLSNERTLEIGLDLADALTRAHRLGIVHRDLKPSNVLLAEDRSPRLTDFGIAYVASSQCLTATDTIVGTIPYLSPEACRGEMPDTRADIWAFGVMLYEMLAGQPPFAGTTFPAVLMAILTQPVPDLHQARPDAPQALVSLIERMLEKNRWQRMPSVRLVGAGLEAILADQKHQGNALALKFANGWQPAARERSLIGKSRPVLPMQPIVAQLHETHIVPRLSIGGSTELEAPAATAAQSYC
jgi:serine/threonine protein kinase